jgi:serine/threonine protein kinase
MKMGLKELLSRLEQDGFSVVGGRLIPIGSETVNQPEEVSSLQRPNKPSTLPNDFSLRPQDGAPLTAQVIETDAQLAAGLSRRFRIVRRLGAGGMGTVFLAEQIGVGNRLVALKVLNRKLLDDPDFLLRFQNEAVSTGRIHHPNVVTIYESAQSDDGTPYIAMEFLEGAPLSEVIKQRGALPVPEVADILRQAARGLNAAHKLGIIHRDLKPDNIFMTEGDEGELVVKLVDFGIAKLRESSLQTKTGLLLGTPAYMSCEQSSGMRSDELDPRSDVYSLGVVVYEMLTGQTPFHADTPIGYLRMHMVKEPPPFHSIAPSIDVSSKVETVVIKALRKNREERYSSASEFANAFIEAATRNSTSEASQRLPSTEVVVSPPVPELSTPVAPPDVTKTDEERNEQAERAQKPSFVSIGGGYRLERREQERLGKEADAVAAIKRNEKMRDDLHRDLLKTGSERMNLPVGSSRWSKFAHSEIIIRRIDDKSYPKIDDGQGISGWFKLEILDFYHGGLHGILNLQYALLDTLTRKWSLLSDEESARSFPRRFSKAKVYVTGKIPWRNILHYDMEGDEYYPQPHLYCTFADAGEPYEGRGFFFVSDGYQQELDAEHKLELDALLKLPEEGQPEMIVADQGTHPVGTSGEIQDIENGDESEELSVSITQGEPENFVILVKNESDSEVTIKKMLLTCKGFSTH